MRVLDRLADHPLRTVFVLALAVRLANVALLSGNDAFFAEADTAIYWTLGRALSDPATLIRTLMTVTDRMPLYPLFVGGVRAAFGEAPRAVAVIQAVLDAGTCSAIAALGALVSRRVGLWAGVIAALSVTLVIYSTQVLTDTLFVFWFALMLLATAHGLAKPSIRTALLAGLAGGLAAATRAAVIPLVLLAAPVLAVAEHRYGRRLAPALAMLAVFLIAASLPVAPVVVRNVTQYGSWSLTSRTGDHLIRWIAPLAAERANGTPYQTTVDRLQARFQERTAERGLFAASNPFRLAAIKSEIAREELLQLPWTSTLRAWIEGMALNLGAPALLADPRVRALPKPSFYNTTGRTLWEKARAYLLEDQGRYQTLMIGEISATLPFLLLAAIGLVMLALRSATAALLASAVLAYFLLLNGPVASPRYRMPMEPILIVLAAIPLAALTRRTIQGPAAAAT